MPRIYTSERPDAVGMRQAVLIATPTYQSLSAGYVLALYNSQAALAAAGIESMLGIFSGNCHVDDSRNKLVAEFLATECTDLMFIDADVHWRAGDLVRLLQYDRGVVAGAYPFRETDEGYPVRWLTAPGERMYTDADGLLEVAAVATGFLRIRREVLEQMAEHAPKFTDKGPLDGARTLPLIFERVIHNGERWGGDYNFCRKWRDLGGTIWLDPEMRFEHYGEHAYQGSVGSWQRRLDGRSMKYRLDEIRAGTESGETYLELHEAWGNNLWAAEGDLLTAAVLMARETEGPILECGSGLSTLVMAAAAGPGRMVYALENEWSWQIRLRQIANSVGLKNIKIECNPLENYGDYDWYSVPDWLPEQFGMAFIDGPPQSTRGGREGFLHQMADRLEPGCAVLMDDVGVSEANRATVARWGEALNAELHVMVRPRPFAVGRVGYGAIQVPAEQPGVEHGSSAEAGMER